jgi:AcrR family transcriptional regulator
MIGLDDEGGNSAVADSEHSEAAAARRSGSVDPRGPGGSLDAGGERCGRGTGTDAVPAAAAGVQVPTLYRLFGDEEGLLDAVTTYGFQQYLTDKQALGETNAPIADLRRSWNLHVEFGLSKPAFCILTYGEGHSREGCASGRETTAILRRSIAPVVAGRLRMSVERATRLVYTSGLGIVLSLIATPPAERDLELSGVAREQVLRAITTDGGGEPAASTDIASRAVALREALREGGTTALTISERALLVDRLDRMAHAAEASPAVRNAPRRRDGGDGQP